MTRRSAEDGRRNPAPRKDLIERSAPFLPPGSVIKQAFIYQSAPSFRYFLLTYTLGIVHWNKYGCVAITDEAIFVLESAKSSAGARPERLLGQLPRPTRIGPVSGRWAELDILRPIAGGRCWVHKRFFDQITATDHAAGFSE
ncbi:hypothetical protein Apa02nite_043680 [Actinoplanes palleronii]|uniref:Uncharacterized protein n=1 Tax=Actinoplanes palleronii TaxID=113570 RepID=A0ABQ4BDB1_9ACTN|nr:hypothetical protein Apa02nite_043680 [Actinoplanes palleronii]